MDEMVAGQALQTLTERGSGTPETHWFPLRHLNPAKGKPKEKTSAVRQWLCLRDGTVVNFFPLYFFLFLKSS